MGIILVIYTISIVVYILSFRDDFKDKGVGKAIVVLFIFLTIINYKLIISFMHFIVAYFKNEGSYYANFINSQVSNIKNK